MDVQTPESGKPHRPARVDSPDALVTRFFLAALLGVDVRSIGNFVAEGMPKAARGRFPLQACVQWYIQREREAARAGKGLNDLDLARQRKTIAEARLAEMGVADKEGSSLPMPVHEERLRARLESVAGAIKANGRYQPDVKAAITDEQADALLDRMADEQLAELFALSDTIE